MRKRLIGKLAMLGVGAVLLAASLQGRAQITGNTPAHVSPIRGARSSEMDDTDHSLTAKRVRALNADRQKMLVSDSEKLVKLARRLDAEVASNPANEWTPEERREAAEMAKLAHDIKVRMAQTFGQDPRLLNGTVTVELP